MKAIQAIAEILKREGVEFLSCYPTTPLIDAAAAIGIRPIICRQERVGVGIADGFSRVSNGRRIGVFAMQYGPGAENAFAGVATAYSDSVPVLVLPMGHPKERAESSPHFSSVRSYAAVTKWVERLNSGQRTVEVLRHAFSLLKLGRPGPVMVEIPWDVAQEEVNASALNYQAVKTTRSGGDPQDIAEAARVLIQARSPVIHAGQGVLYAEAHDELLQLAELLQIPVMTTLAGKSAFPEDHPLSLGTGGPAMTGPIYHCLRKADVIFGIGCSFTRHIMATNIPPGKVIIHATNDAGDINKTYPTEYPILGDAKLVLGQFIEAVKGRLGGRDREDNGSAAEVKAVRDRWMAEWRPKLLSDEVPINPYRVIWEFMRVVDPREAIVTHDSGSPRDQMTPFYKAVGPRSYLGWGKSHGLGTGLGLTIGAKLAAPDKLAVHVMGDAAFGMVGLDFETAVRCGIPILAIVLNNSSMAIEARHMPISHERYRARDMGGHYADMAKAMGGYAERIENPAEIAPALQRARRVTEEEGRPVLLEFITSEEITFSYRNAL